MFDFNTFNKMLVESPTYRQIIWDKLWKNTVSMVRIPAMETRITDLGVEGRINIIKEIRRYTGWGLKDAMSYYREYYEKNSLITSGTE